MPEGTVRWFDAERGFGFLYLGDGADDLFVHASEIIGDDVLREGQVVEFELGEGDRGPQARRVRVTGERAPDALLGVLGTVSWYEPGKGYGFVTPDGGGAEIFVHSSAIVGGGVISEGQRVAFLIVDGERGRGRPVRHGARLRLHHPRCGGRRPVRARVCRPGRRGAGRGRPGPVQGAPE